MECTTLRDDIMDVLYGEADAATKERVDAHHAVCAPCRAELAAFRRLRHELAEWRLPGSLRPQRSRAGSVGWLGGLAAAAGILLTLSGAWRISGSEIRYENGQLSFRVGRPGALEIERLLAEQEARHRQDIEAVRASLPAAETHDEEAFLRRMDAMIHDSETRQALVLDSALADISERAEAQRRYDLAQVSLGLSYLQGQTGQQMARTSELLGTVLQASHKR